MNARGLTLVELCVGLATATIIGAASAGILKAGIMTYTHSVRQNDALTRTRKALGGEGSAAGVLREGRSAHTVNALDAAAVGVLTSSSSILASYYTSAGDLFLSKGGVAGLHADKITSVAVSYYNMDSSGLIMESTSAVSATMVTALVTLQSPNPKHKDHALFSGALLRNHP